MGGEAQWRSGVIRGPAGASRVQWLETPRHQEQGAARNGVTARRGVPRRRHEPPHCAVDSSGSPNAVVVEYDVSGCSANGTFSDVDASIFEADIESMAAPGITKGRSPPANSKFCPDAAVTRGQMAAFLVRALDLTAGLDDPFTDDDSILRLISSGWLARGSRRAATRQPTPTSAPTTSSPEPKWQPSRTERSADPIGKGAAEHARRTGHLAVSH